MPEQQRPKSHQAGKWFLWSGVLAAVSVGGWLVYAALLNRPAAPIPVALVEVQRGNIESTINESGTVELRGQKTVKSPIEGAVEQVLVRPGERVRAGQTLLTLRLPERQTALAAQQLQIQQQTINLKRQQQRVQDAREQLTIEERKLKGIADLATQGVLSQQQLQDREDRVRTARNSLRDAEAGVATASIDLQKAQLEQQRIVRQLQNSTITAPIDSVVLDVKVKDGEGVQLRTDLLTLGDPSQEYIQLQLSTLDANRVRPNQLARVSVIGPDASVFTGRGASLYPQALASQPQAGSRQSEQATVPTLVKLDRPSRRLIPGSQVNVEIVLEQASNVVLLNTEAIQRSSAQPFVWIKARDGTAQQQPITLGLEGLLNVEIKSGLTPADRVILPPAEPPLKPNTPIVAK